MVTKVGKQLTEMRNKIEFLESAKRHLEMLYAEQWGLDINLLYSFATRYVEKCCVISVISGSKLIIECIGRSLSSRFKPAATYMWYDQGKWVTCRQYLFLSFQYNLLSHIKSYILIHTPLQSDIWFERYEQFFEFQNNVKHRTMSSVLAYNSNQY